MIDGDPTASSKKADDDRVSREQCLNDMCDPNGGIIADAARKYYYEHYATENERKMMDAEDRKNEGIAKFVFGLITGVLLYAIFHMILEGICM